MPRYRFTYTLETPISAERDVTFEHDGFQVHLAFSARIDENHIRLQSVAEGDTWLAANEALMDHIVPPVLDAICLHRKAPAMLQDLLSVVKSEAGTLRKAVVLEHRFEKQIVALGDRETAEIQETLHRRPALPHAVMRWLRYCYRPITVLERFVFSWFAFENRAGTTQVQRQCPHCGKDLPSHPALNRDQAFHLLQAEQPAMSRDQFDILFRQWSSELRNPVFHGGRAVTTPMRTRMQDAMNVYRMAVEHDLQHQSGYRLAYPGLIPQDGLLQHNIYHFVEYTIADAAMEFADPPNLEGLMGFVERQELPQGLTLLNEPPPGWWIEARRDTPFQKRSLACK